VAWTFFPREIKGHNVLVYWEAAGYCQLVNVKLEDTCAMSKKYIILMVIKVQSETTETVQAQLIERFINEPITTSTNLSTPHPMK